LTTSPKGCHDQKPRWSPIAPSVVFFRFCETTPHGLIYTVNTSTRLCTWSRLTALFDQHDRIENPDFMPGGKRIALTANCSAPGDCIDNTNRIVTVDLNGGQRVSITHEPTCDPEVGCYPYESLQASPDWQPLH